MAKQKITDKKLAPNLVRNVNDESVTGNEYAHDLSVSKVLGAITPRPGVVQADIGQCLIAPLFLQSNIFVAPQTGSIDMKDWKSTQYGVAFKAPGNMSLLNIILAVKRDTGFTGGFLSARLYNFNASTRQIGSALTADNPISTDTVKTTFDTLTLPLSSPVSVIENDWYIILFSSSGVLPVAGTSIYIATTTNITNAAAFSVYMPSTVVPVITPLSQVTPFTMTYTSLSQGNFGNVTNVIESAAPNENFISVIESAASYDNGNLRAITHDALDTAPVTEQNITARVFPGAYYGARVEQGVHSFAAFYAAQLSGRVTPNDPNVVIPKETVGIPKLNLSTNYPMYKRAKGQTKWVPLDSDVSYSTGKSISIWSEGIADWQGHTEIKNLQFVQGTQNANGSYNYQVSVPTANIMSMPKKIFGTYNANTKLFSQSVNAMFPGTYEYAFEFVDKTGMVYSTCSAQLPNTLTPPPAITIIPATIPAISPGSVAYNFYSGMNAAIMRIPVPDAPYNTADDYPVVNVYRRYKSQYRQTGIGTSAGGNKFIQGSYVTNQADFVFVAALDKTYYNAATSSWEYIDIANDSSLALEVLKQKHYYIPSAADIALYKGRLIAIGDGTYPNYVFCGRDNITDFWLEDAQQVSFPAGDFYFTAMKQFKDALYIFSNSGTWELRLVSTSAPYFSIRPVSTEYGCISTSEGIVDVGHFLLIPTQAGLKIFNGIEWQETDTLLNRVFSSINTSQIVKATYGAPSINVGTVDAFNITGCYDPILDEVWYTIPDGAAMAVYVFGLNDKKWRGAVLPNVDSVVRLRKVPHYFNTNGNIYKIDVNQTQDFFTTMGLLNGTPIPLHYKTTPIDLGEKSKIKTFRIWGKGAVTVSLYLDKAATTSITGTYTLDQYGDTGLEVRLGWDCRYMQLEITSTDPAVTIKGFEFYIENQGVKLFENSK